MKEKIELKDFLDFKYISNITYSPDRKHAACIVSTGNEEDNQYERVLYIMNEDGTNLRQLTTSQKESMFLWMDQEHILFMNMRNKKDKEACKQGEERTCFYRINIHGGEAQFAFSIPLQVSEIRPVSATQYVLQVSYHEQYSCMYSKNADEKQAICKEKEDMKDYEIFDEVPFYQNGKGITNKQRSALFLFDVNTNELTRISEPYFQVGDFEVSEDHTKLYFTGELYKACAKNKDGLYVYDLTHNTMTTMVEASTYSIQKVLPWKKDIIVLASDQRTYGLNENAKFYKFDETEQTLRLFADYEDSIGSSVGSDCRYGGGRSIKVEGEYIYFITTIYNRSILYRMDTQGHIESVYDEQGSVDAFDIAYDRILFVGMQDMRLQELYQYTIQNKTRTQVSMFNEAYYMTKDIRPCIPCHIQQGDMTIYGWVLTPSNYDEHATYPAILDIHGGPKTVYGEVYYHEMQVWANQGYIVFFMNPRGGDGRGNTFMDIRGKYGTMDYEDLMAFTTTICNTYPCIDQTRLGVTGGSYGGFMTNWIIGHTTRFQAAASQRSISNWISFANTSDIGDYFTQDQQGGNIYDDYDKLWNHSPLKYARNVQTPTLFIHSDEDYRCPLSEGMQMYAALLNQGVEARLCLFHGENHELSRSGKPKHRVKRLEEITKWMNSHLQIRK